uniref:Uncharacterized protein n=1 Tax=Panagrolaimus davidi TaxID=227884 RepID=A0A914PUZ4_9BILA
MEPSEFTIVKRIKFNKVDLESIKDYGNLHTSKSFVSNIPGIRYLIAIFPYGDLEKHHGQTRIFLCLELPTGMKVEAEVIFSVASANYTTVLKQRYDKSIDFQTLKFLVKK